MPQSYHEESISSRPKTFLRVTKKSSQHMIDDCNFYTYGIYSFLSNYGPHEPLELIEMVQPGLFSLYHSAMNFLIENNYIEEVAE